MNDIFNRFNYAKQIVLIAKKYKDLPTSIQLRREAGPSTDITDSSFNEAMLEYLSKDWDTHYRGALGVLRKKEKQALYECKAFIDAQVACIGGVKSAPEVEPKSEHPTKIAIEMLDAFRTRPLLHSERDEIDLYEKLPDLMGMKLYFHPLTPVNAAISQGKISDLTPLKEYEIVGIHPPNNYPIIYDDNGYVDIIALHRTSLHLNGLTYFHIKEEILPGEQNV